MSLLLADYRTSVQRMVGGVVDSATWNNDLLDEALRNALQEFAEKGPTVEVTFIASADGHLQDLELVDLYSIVRLAWPWDSDVFRPADWAVPFRRREESLVVLETDMAPVAGDSIQVIYRRLWTIQNLDSAASTSVEDKHARVLTTLGAYYACLLRLRQLSENPKLTSTQTDETITTVTSGDRTTTVTTGDRTTTTTTGDRTTTVSSGDTTVTTSANENRFPPIPVQTVTTDHPTVTTVEDIPTVTTVEDIPTVTTVEDIPTTEASRTTTVEANLHEAAITGLEKALAHFRTLADERLARLDASISTFVNPSWARIGL